jgi:hypothetical protein
MTDPDRQHSSEPAEGDAPGDDDPGGRTPHPEDPAEGPPLEADGDEPSAPAAPGER